MESTIIQRIQKLKEECEDKIKEIVNPDDSDWEDVGFDSPPSGYDTVDSYLRAEEDFDESQQAEMGLLEEFIEKLEEIEKEFTNNKS